MTTPAPKGKPSPLLVKTLDFMGPMATADGWRPEVNIPEVALSGRSNVGKSSLLNRLVKRKGFARVSNTPGRTREINFFEVNKQFALVDLPGYGYARISKERKEIWKPLIEGFLRTSPMLAGLVQLLDARREPTPDDQIMFDLLEELALPTLFVLTKVDKLRPAERAAQTALIARVIGTTEDQLIPFSAVTDEGRDELAEAIEGLVAAPIMWRGVQMLPEPSRDER